MTGVRDDYERFLARRHRPAHGRRTAERWAAFLLPHLSGGMRVLDVGCGPGSITTGLPGRVVGVDLQPVAVDGVPVVGADGTSLPFATASFDAVHANALLQHVDDPAALLREVRRVCRAGAVVGVADVDWGAAVLHPPDPLLERGQQLREALRDRGDVRVGRRLRDLLAGAGFERVEVAVRGNVVATAEAAAGVAAFEGAWFEAPEVVALAEHLGLADEAELAAVAAAWTRWAAHPGACSASLWFTALGWCPGGDR